MAIEIPIDRPNLGPYFADLDRLNAKFKEVQASADNLSEAAGAKPSKGGGAKGMGGGRAINWDDPWGKLDSLRLQRYLGKREGLGDDALRGLDLAIARQTKRVSRAEKEMSGGKTQGEKLLDALMTSRVTMGMGGRMQFAPLFGKLASAGLVDPSKHLNALDKFANVSALIPLVTKLAIPVAAVVAGVTGAYRLVESGSEKTHAIGNAYFMGGGNPYSTAQGAGIASFLGMTAEQAAQRAVELGDRLRGGGYGASYLRSKGIVDQGIWTTNKMGNYVKALDVLSKIPSEIQAIRVARDLGLTNELWVRKLSGQTRQRLLESQNPPTESELRADAEFRAQKAIVGSQFDNLHRSWAQNQMGFAANFLDRQSRGWWNWIPLVAGYNASAAAIDTVRGRGPASGTGVSDTKENTQAIKDMTRTMKDHAEWLGGGPRARNAMPAAWTYMQMEEGLRSDARSLGAFSV